MSTMNDGGPAFPTDSEGQNGPNTWHHPGMSLRDWFAGQYLSGIAARDDVADPDEAADEAVTYADAMIERLKR